MHARPKRRIFVSSVLVACTTCRYYPSQLLSCTSRAKDELNLPLCLQLFVYGCHPVWRYRLRKIPGDHPASSDIQSDRVVWGFTPQLGAAFVSLSSSGWVLNSHGIYRTNRSMVTREPTRSSDTCASSPLLLERQNSQAWLSEVLNTRRCCNKELSCIGGWRPAQPLHVRRVPTSCTQSGARSMAKCSRYCVTSYRGATMD